MRYYQIASLLLVPAVLLCTGCRRNPNISTEANSLVDQWMADETTAPKEPANIAKNDIDDGAAAADSFEYSVTDGNVQIDKFTGKETDVTISSHIGEYPVTAVGQYAFEACWDVTSVTLPDSVQYIGEFAFMDCSSMTKINIPEGVPALYRGTFAGCSSLTTVTLPASVAETAEELFTGCPLTDLYIYNTDLTYMSWGLEELEEPCTIHAPAGAAILTWAAENGFPTEEIQ